MKVYQLDKILQDVRISLDENMTSSALEGFMDVDTLSLNELIRSKIVEGVRRIHASAPTYLLDSGYHFGDSLYWRDLESGWCLLPENFMRLIVFKMSDWERSVYHAIGEDDEGYAKQSSRFKGLRGTAQKPVCAIVSRPEGRVLEFYSCKSTAATVSKAVYLPYPQIDRYGGLEICERCYRAVVYQIGALVLMSVGDVEKGRLFLELSNAEVGLSDGTQ